MSWSSKKREARWWICDMWMWVMTTMTRSQQDSDKGPQIYRSFIKIAHAKNANKETRVKQTQGEQKEITSYLHRVYTTNYIQYIYYIPYMIHTYKVRQNL